MPQPPVPAVRATLRRATRALALGLTAAGLATAVRAAPVGAQQVTAPDAPRPDPRVGLKPGVNDAGEAIWNLRLVSTTPPSDKFKGGVNSDLAFSGNHVIQGSFSGFQVWDVSDRAKPTLVTAQFCPASQSDVSIYKNLLFVSGEGPEGRLDCGAGGVRDTVSAERLRGIRIFDVSDIRNPKYVANVQTCRGSHTHSVLVDPKDRANVYVYVSGSADVRSPKELPGCVRESPEKDANSALFRIEVIKVPLAAPEKAAIVSSPRIFRDLVQPARHGEAPDDRAAALEAEKRGAFVVFVPAIGETITLPPPFVSAMLDSVVKARAGTGAPTGTDSAALRRALPDMIARMIGEGGGGSGPRPGPTQCHDITLYPAIGLAGGACEGYGLLLDIRDPANPKRLAAVADSNFAYWHSATFNNTGRTVVFTDEWGGGSAPKCRASDPQAWGANAIFTVNGGQMEFQSYYKLPAAQTRSENCVAHNGSLVPIPGRDVMVQAWYQGGISMFDFTDPKRPMEIAYFDRGPIDTTQAVLGGSWSVYWYNGAIYSSEIVRGLDVFELVPSAHLTQNEIDAAKTVRFEQLNPQGQPRLSWPPSFALARAYADQLERAGQLPAARLAAVRDALAKAEGASGAARRTQLTQLATRLAADAKAAPGTPKIGMLADAVRQLAAAR